METIFDLPAHPMFAHFPIVLAPLVALAAIALALRPSWRAPFGPLVVGASVVSLVAIVLARKSGEEMFELLQREPSIDKHEDLATQSMILWFLFVLATAAMIVLHRRSTRLAAAPTNESAASAGTARSAAGTVVSVLAAVTIVLGLVSSVWIARTGHEGAKSHWSFVNQQ